ARSTRAVYSALSSIHKTQAMNATGRSSEVTDIEKILVAAYREWSRGYKLYSCCRRSCQSLSCFMKVGHWGIKGSRQLNTCCLHMKNHLAVFIETSPCGGISPGYITPFPAVTCHRILETFEKKMKSA
ncbi:hypothetical protein XELAEV_18017172mg, partial [Xenopus laevis]